MMPDVESVMDNICAACRLALSMAQRADLRKVLEHFFYEASGAKSLGQIACESYMMERHGGMSCGWDKDQPEEKAWEAAAQAVAQGALYRRHEFFKIAVDDAFAAHDRNGILAKRIQLLENFMRIIRAACVGKDYAPAGDLIDEIDKALSLVQKERE